MLLDNVEMWGYIWYFLSQYKTSVQCTMSDFYFRVSILLPESEEKFNISEVMGVSVSITETT